MKNLEKIIKGGIIAMIPVYIESKGNSTKMIFEKYDDLYIYNRIDTVLKLIADYYTVDLRCVRREYGKGIDSKNMIPIPLNKRDVLVQIKTRIPISKNDGSSGYFNLRYIDKVVKKDGSTFIKTTKGNNIKVLNRERTIIKHINEGKLVKQLYNEKMETKIKEEPINYKTPATKEDIALLIREIVDIKSRL